MEKIVSVSNLSFSYGSSKVLEDISFEVAAGDFVALVGPNGAGKSTLAKVLLGLETGFSGTVELFGRPLADFSAWENIGYLPQRVNVFNPMFPATVSEVVGLGLLAGKRYPRRLGADDKEKVAAALASLGITDLRDRPIAALSGGQQQRVFLARALVSQPRLLIMDEPNTALDPQTKAGFFRTLQELNGKQGTAIIMITHDSAQAGDYANKLLYLDQKAVFYGSFADFCQAPAMSAYFGSSQHLICHQHQH